jgi:hypothetical protein
MEEDNNTVFGEILKITIERHTLNEWGFLFLFFIICLLLISKSKNIGGFFLSISDNEKIHFLPAILGGFVGIYVASAFLSAIVIFIFFLVKLVLSSAGYALPSINILNLSVECSFIWAITACGHVRSQERREYIAEISYLKEQLTATQKF